MCRLVIARLQSQCNAPATSAGDGRSGAVGALDPDLPLQLNPGTEFYNVRRWDQKVVGRSHCIAGQKGEDLLLPGWQLRPHGRDRNLVTYKIRCSCALNLISRGATRVLPHVRFLRKVKAQRNMAKAVRQVACRGCRRQHSCGFRKLLGSVDHTANSGSASDH